MYKGNGLIVCSDDFDKVYLEGYNKGIHGIRLRDHGLFRSLLHRLLWQKGNGYIV